MKYLMFYACGFVKKFPLNNSIATIGRTSDNDLVIKEEFISRQHVQISQTGINKDNSVTIIDLNSTNGVHIGKKRVAEAIIKVGESFNLGRMEFFLKEGDLEEFELAEELIPIFNSINKENRKKFEYTETINVKDIYSDILKHILQTGLKKNSFQDFILELSNDLSKLTDFGSLYVLIKEKNDFNILFSINSKKGLSRILKQAIKANKKIFIERLSFVPLADTEDVFYSYPVEINKKRATLLYISSHEKKTDDPEIDNFLSILAREIELLSSLQRDNKIPILDIKTDEGRSVKIVTANKDMEELIKQCKKIAVSDIFVLIQGESGTGKELFARFIHENSRRSENEFVAINCAAIPENLLESELFGYEKGAFTGAYSQKTGKLELASGGTLVLDEVGDMTLNLQARLLRALQEHEFFRLGGSIPTKVDLRILSITNQNLKQLINEGKFRQDLYYRLVHRSITIPPLRERREDISVLINHFSNKFCKLINKTINGYSVKAFEALQNFDWKGNVRQLENEINSIINLTDDGEIISFEILSEELKNHGKASEMKTLDLSFMKNKDMEKEYIINKLQENDWNKSKTAREINMTYRGLHKKMNKLGIQKPE